MKLILVAPDSSLAAAFQEHFYYLPNVEIVNDYFEWLPNYDCLVSPGNSFGMSEAARQMALAYDHFLYPPKHLNCFVAASRQLLIWEGSC
ncbi:hypothetical protein H6G33_20690 [Calothrix sp. FACHB-1219]|uniref:hypothetical protein n=1 Tax=unclassified Calothrix TaxID=2619626 RepID=UPI001686889D|nr:MULTISPECIES: hypothetical protein [unclassified Calothrix]MBD2206397.1 hypothetical protein [Calothrix sp. FACHB-168]MBD2219437.1 hypothetical protein [Calothrix sp. FACHB-1219]